MIGQSLRCVILRRSVADEKCPIAGLREQELSRELTKNAVIISRCLLATRFCQLGHAGVGGQKMRINPATFLIETDIKNTLITPTGGLRLRHLLGGLFLEKFARRGY